MARPTKYGEPTKTISFKVPESKKEIYKEKVTQYINSIETTFTIEKSVTCGCKYEGKLFRRDKNCKLTKEQHNL